VHADSSEVTISNCDFYENNAEEGGGIYCYNSNLFIDNTTIRDNNSPDGGGVYAFESTINITNSRIRNNTSQGGGGIYLNAAKLDMFNSEITKNYGDLGGGITMLDFSDFSIFNSTIANNSAPSGGGAIFSKTLGEKSVITNSIIWGNGTNPIYIAFGNPVVIEFSNVEGGYEGEGNIDSEPLFIKGSHGDYYLSQTASGQDKDSPCINAGSDTAVNLGLNLNPTRTDGSFDTGKVDMGYHQQPHLIFDLDIILGTGYAAHFDIYEIYLYMKAHQNFSIDLYLVMIDPSGNIYSLIDWEIGVRPALTGLNLPDGFSLINQLLTTFSEPAFNPLMTKPGVYTFAIAATHSENDELISNVGIENFEVEGR